MRINRHSEMVRPDSSRRRVLSFLLLGLIVYGTTVQAVHKHGVVLRDGSSEAVAVSIPSPEDITKRGLTGCADCLVCQLQQSFSAPLVTHLDVDPPAAQVIGFFDAGRQPAFSFVVIRESGRAPPLTS